MDAPQTSARHRGGFSLVEVTIALGIIVFALVALLGLLPVGLQTFDGAVDSTITTQIAQGIITTARQGKFSELTQLTPPQYFDEQGQQGAGIKASNYVYRSSVQVTTPLAVPDTASTTANPNTARIGITITRISDPQHPRTFQAWIADNGL